MMHLTWRQARPNIVSCAILLAILGLTAILVEHSMAVFVHNTGLDTCTPGTSDCAFQVNAFRRKYDVFLSFYGWLNFVPMLLGAFWGGPLIAREIEQGTHRLAWSQSVTRRRWLATKLGMYLGGAFAAAAIVTWLMTFWLHPVLALRDDYVRLQPEIFDFVGIVPIGYTLFAFSVGAAAGAVTRRMIPAMAITVPIFLTLRLWFESIRGQLITPLTATAPFTTGKGPVVPLGAWIANKDVVDPAGHVVDFIAKVPDQCLSVQGSTDSACAPVAGYRWVVTYQPPNRFWTFQFIEFGVFMGATVLCLAVAVWWTLRRAS